MTEEVLAVRWGPGPIAAALLPAEIDAANAGKVSALLDSVLVREPVILVADMTVTRFCDSSGAAVLVRAAKKAARVGVSLRVVVVSPVVQRAFDVLRLGALLDVRPSLAAALADTVPGLGLFGRGGVPAP